jgi:hypothetical protein
MSFEGAVNPILANPEAALAITGGLIVTGGALTLRHIVKAVGLKGLSDEERYELIKLDEEAPAGFWHRAVCAVHDAASRGPSVLKWRRGNFDLARPIGYVGLDPDDAEMDLQTTQVRTPIYEMPRWPHW